MCPTLKHRLMLMHNSALASQVADPTSMRMRIMSLRILSFSSKCHRRRRRALSGPIPDAFVSIGKLEALDLRNARLATGVQNPEPRMLLEKKENISPRPDPKLKKKNSKNSEKPEAHIFSSILGHFSVFEVFLLRSLESCSGEEFFVVTQ